MHLSWRRLTSVTFHSFIASLHARATAWQPLVITLVALSLFSGSSIAPVHCTILYLPPLPRLSNRPARPSDAMFRSKQS